MEIFNYSSIIQVQVIQMIQMIPWDVFFSPVLQLIHLISWNKCPSTPLSPALSAGRVEALENQGSFSRWEFLPESNAFGKFHVLKPFTDHSDSRFIK